MLMLASADPLEHVPPHTLFQLAPLPVTHQTTMAVLAIVAFLFIHVNGISQGARSLMEGTYGHHGHHEQHTSEGTHGHEAAHDLEHVRGEALPADVPAQFDAVTSPTKHYEDDESVALGHDHNGIRDGDAHATGHGKEMNPVLAVMAAPLLYLWNFAPHPFKPGPGGSVFMWVPDL